MALGLLRIGSLIGVGGDPEKWPAETVRIVAMAVIKEVRYDQDNFRYTAE